MICEIHLKSGRTARVSMEPAALRKLFLRSDASRIFFQPTLVIHGMDCTAAYNVNGIEYFYFPKEAEISTKISPQIVLISEESYRAQRAALEQDETHEEPDFDFESEQVVAEFQFCSGSRLYATFRRLAQAKTDLATLLSNLFSPQNVSFLRHEHGGHVLMNNTLIESIITYPSRNIDIRTAWQGDLLPAMGN